MSRSNARAGPEESANDMQPSADLTDAEEGTSLPQEPAVVVDVADIGLHSRPIDYVLVYAVEPEESPNSIKRANFLSQLKEAGLEIEEVDETKDLGVEAEENFQVESHGLGQEGGLTQEVEGLDHEAEDGQGTEDRVLKKGKGQGPEREVGKDREGHSLKLEEGQAMVGRGLDEKEGQGRKDFGLEIEEGETVEGRGFDEDIDQDFESGRPGNEEGQDNEGHGVRIEEGQVLDVQTVEGGVMEAPAGMRYVKIHVPMEVLKQYGEILRMRLKLKASTPHPMEVDDSNAIAQTTTQGLDPKESWLDRVKQSMDRLQRRFQLDPKLFPGEKEHNFTAPYSRDKDYLFEEDEAKYFSPAAKSRIVEFIMQRARFLPVQEDEVAFGLNRLVAEGVFFAGYPLHDGAIDTPGSRRKLLSEEWASWSKMCKYQPLDGIRDYFGIKLGLYFAWFGFYTAWLIPPSLMGLVWLIHGLASISYDPVAADICGDGPMANTSMCPSCDYDNCKTWLLKEECDRTRVKHLFDNALTVVFAFLMSLWSVIFLDSWKRYSAEICHRWDVDEFDPEEEPPRPAYLLQLKDVDRRHWRVNFVTQENEPRPPFWEMKLPRVVLSWTTVTLMVVVAGIVMLAIVGYEMSLVAAIFALDDHAANHGFKVSVTGAVFNLITIVIFNQAYGYLAEWLTKKELHRTETLYHDSLIVKNYLFQSVSYYTSIFYIAFLKGQFIGTPNHYHRLFSQRLEECQPGGCFMELTIQLAALFCGKSIIFDKIRAYALPQLMPILLKYRDILLKKCKKCCCKPTVPEKQVDVKSVEKPSTPQYEKDYELLEWGREGLFYEYLELVIQYGFITVFVCAFPLAPLFALVNNMIELRADAKKLLEKHRRPIAQKVRNIGVWFNILETMGWVSVITNGLIIALTSEFIPKMVYTHHYSEDQTLNGYVNFSLSYFDLTDLDPRSKANVTTGICRYSNYRSGPNDDDPYTPNLEFWHIWVARLLFLVIFVNVVRAVATALSLLIPDVPAGLRYHKRREEFMTTKLVLEKEKERLAGKRKMSDVVLFKKGQRPSSALAKENSEV